MPDRTDTDATIEIAQAAVPRSGIPLGGTMEVPVAALPLPPDWTAETVDAEQWAAAPRRARGTVEVHDAVSFARAVRQRAIVDEVTIYTDEDRKALVAILNDDQVNDDGDQSAAWRDYRVLLALRPRPEWTHWRSIDGQYVNQETFAEHIERGLPELVAPPAAEALEIAQTFQANVAAKFRQGSRLRDGAQQFTYEEEIDASAGGGGLLTIPEVLVIRVAPCFGADQVDVEARFRFRLRSGELTLGYLLDRPDEVERTAFTNVVDKVVADLALDPIMGVAPSPR